MRNGFLELRSLTAAILAAVFLAANCLAQTERRTNIAQEESLKRFLQKYLRDSVASDDKTVQYFPAFVDLKDDGTKEVIVYLTNGGWCGSGGCTTLVLAPQGSSYQVITKIMITRPPIRILATKSNGWHDIAVRVQGGGVVRAYEAKLSFNGKSYPISPSVPSARRLAENVPGNVVVPVTALTERGKPLYP